MDPTSDTWHTPHLATAMLATSAVSNHRRFFPPKTGRVKGSNIRDIFQVLGRISHQLKPQYNHRSPWYFMAYSCLHQDWVRVTAATLKLSNEGKFRLATWKVRFGFIQLSYQSFMGNAPGMTMGLSFPRPAFGSRAQSSGYA